MKKILFKSGSTMMGGLEKVQIEYINFLVKQEKYQIKIVIENDNGRDNSLEKYINSNVTYLKDYNYILEIKNLRENRKKSLWSRIKYNLAITKEKKYADNKFLQIYKEYKPDIVIDFDSSLTKIIDKLNSSKNLVWIHSSIKNWKKKKSKIDRFVDRISKYSKIICICKEMKEDLINLKNELKKKVDFLYNPIDFDRIKKLSNEDFSEEDKKLLKDKFLLSIARLDCVPKDFETLFKAYEIAKKNGYDGKLYIIGDGPDKDKVEKLKEANLYKEDILLLGRKENPYNWLKKADKLILSSRYEGFAIVLLEGLCLGKNVIASDCKTGPNEILANNRGLLFKVGDYSTLAKYIISEKNKEELEFSLEEFERNRIFEKFLEILED
ncbi:glycosyltransferase [Fusobacterium pseudoperiodonticum]|jgi:glycosyltransferase|uniref:glycosyltransferase n=1 Tax=Fusobacterium pseudoperiodonticum TaxID=2663009 RepID=UPI0028D73E05|nr:glycosyltransferase [Fusobacterium pseudoperiodonticum]